MDIGVLAVTCSSLFFVLLLHEVNRKIAFIPQERSSETTFKRLRWIIVCDCMIVMPFGIIYLAPLKPVDSLWIMIIIYSVIGAIINVILIIYLKPEDYKNCNEKKIDLNTIVAISIFVISIVTCAIAGKLDSYKKEQFVSFCYDDKTITSTEYLYMVGQTSKYVFMYDAKLNKTSVYPIDELKYFSIQDKKKNK